jgi:SAM-dependent methyltransferase
MNPEYTESTYGDRSASIYDQWHPSAPDEMIAALTDLAGTGPVLELGIGTGRVALKLTELGLEVHGIDASEAMIAKLRAKTGGNRIPVTPGNFADVEVDASYTMIFVVFNTFFCFASQEEQVRCFANVAKHLRSGGLFVIEAFIPDLTRFTHHQNTQTTQVGSDEVRMDVSRHDPLTQRVFSQHVVISEAATRLYPVQIRYAWPSELDLMARLAGMRLRERWSNWRRDPLTNESTNHISIYELL